MCPPGTDIEKYLKACATENGFEGAELVERVSRNIVPKTHAKFFFQLAYTASGRRDKILLDVLFEDSQYKRIEKLPIRSPFLKTDGNDVLVKVPSKADLLGDKLTAFAPNTTGIPFVKNGSSRSMEVAKQMFDVASLFDVVDDLDTVSRVYKRIVEVEKSYRGLDAIGYKDVLMDTINTSMSFATRGETDMPTYRNLVDGIGRVSGFIHTTRYTGESAGTDAAKAAYLASCLYAGVKTPERFNADMVEDLASVSVQPVLHQRLNRLKRTDIESFFYWQKASELLK